MLCERWSGVSKGLSCIQGTPWRSQPSISKRKSISCLLGNYSKGSDPCCPLVVPIRVFSYWWASNAPRLLPVSRGPFPGFQAQKAWFLGKFYSLESYGRLRGQSHCHLVVWMLRAGDCFEAFSSPNVPEESSFPLSVSMSARERGQGSRQNSLMC